VRLHPVLEEHAKLDVSLLARLYERVCSFCSYVDGLFNEHVQSATGGSNALIGMNTRSAADSYNFHRPVIQKRLQVGVDDTAKSASQRICLFAVLPVDGCDLHAFYLSGRSCVCLTDVTGAQNPDMNWHKGYSLAQDGIGR